MNLLLLLSAMLSALSGAGLGVRAPQVPVAVNSVVAVAASAQVAGVTRAGRPVAVLPRLSVAVLGPVVSGWRIVAAAPLYLSRRRE